MSSDPKYKGSQRKEAAGKLETQTLNFLNPHPFNPTGPKTLTAGLFDGHGRIRVCLQSHQGWEEIGFDVSRGLGLKVYHNSQGNPGSGSAALTLLKSLKPPYPML